MIANPVRIGILGLKSTPGSLLLGLAAILLTGMAASLLIVKPVLGAAAAVAVIAAFLFLYLLDSVLSGTVGPSILMWAFFFPLGYYFLSFPRENSILTFDRALPLLFLPAMAFASPKSSVPLPDPVRRCATAWVVFLTVAAISLIRAGDLIASGRLFFDGFLLPAFFGWCIIRNFQVRQNTGILHLLVSLMAVYVACIAVAEVILKKDILPLPGSALFFAGALPRPNGPLYSDDSLAVIGLVTFFFLLFLRKALGDQLPFWRRTIHAFGVTGALAMALLPMFRSVLVTLMLVLVVEFATARKPSQRALRAALLVVCLTSSALIKTLAHDAFEDRSRPDNFYARIAEQMQALQVIRDNPVFGVGLGQFMSVVDLDTRYLALYEGVQSLNSPHNNLSGIFSETGILGFIPYVTAQVMLVLMFWRVRKRRTQASQLVWSSFLYIFLSYWVNGMTLAVGYNSDLNLWFIVALCVVYKYAMSEPVHPGRAVNPVSVSDAAGLAARYPGLPAFARY